MEFVCFVWISEQTANFALCSTERLVFITVVESVYSAVRTESLYKADTFRLRKGQCNVKGKGNFSSVMCVKYS